jgi:hypothetical protein
MRRLVKLWACAHELNDASRNTFNSTSLLYLAIFFLQQQQLLPPLASLVAAEQLNDGSKPPLHAANKWVAARRVRVHTPALQRRRPRINTCAARAAPVPTGGCGTTRSSCSACWRQPR